jgi:hypothetical protein
LCLFDPEVRADTQFHVSRPGLEAGFLVQLVASEYRQFLPNVDKKSTEDSGGWTEKSVRELTRIEDKREAVCDQYACSSPVGDAGGSGNFVRIWAQAISLYACRFSIPKSVPTRSFKYARQSMRVHSRQTKKAQERLPDAPRPGTERRGSAILGLQVVQVDARGPLFATEKTHGAQLHAA